MTLRASVQVDADRTSNRTGASLLGETTPSYKMTNGGMLTIMVSVKVNAWGGASSRIPSSSPSEVMFSPDEPKL
jgi:hypothetical protein